jgi:hypothetical protein
LAAPESALAPIFRPAALPAAVGIAVGTAFCFLALPAEAPGQ